MAIDISTIAPKTRKTRARKSGESRAKQTVYVARGGDEVYLVSKDRAAAQKALKDNGREGEPEEYGSRRNLPPSVVISLFKKAPDLASLHLATGGKWGARSQNESSMESIATILKEAFDARNALRRSKGKAIIPLPSVDEGQWTEIRTTTQKSMSSDEMAALLALDDEFGEDDES
jgi:hypothetical protein